MQVRGIVCIQVVEKAEGPKEAEAEVSGLGHATSLDPELSVKIVVEVGQPHCTSLLFDVEEEL